MMEEQLNRRMFGAVEVQGFSCSAWEVIMITEVTGTVEKGALKLDGALPFPDQTRVRLRIEPIWDTAAARKAWQALLAKIDEHPILGGGGPYSREDLYDRDCSATAILSRTGTAC